MGAIRASNGIVTVKFDDTMSDMLFANQGESARTYEIRVVDLNDEVIDTSDIELKFNLFVRRMNQVGTITAIKNDEGNFIVTIPQGYLLNYDTSAEYVIYIVDKNNLMLSQKKGDFQIYRNPSFDSGDGTNLLLDYDEVKRALLMLEEYKKHSSDNLNETIKARDAAIDYGNKALESANKSEVIKEEMKDIFDTEENRKLAHENRTVTWNNWWDIVENVKTGWKTAFSKWTHTFSNWTSKVEEWFNKFTGIETAEQKRVENENIRISSEDNRILNFKSWSLKVQDFITNDANHQHNETERISKMNEILSEWNVLKEQLANIEAGNLQLQINDLTSNLKGYIKSGQVNTIENTIELFLGSDLDEPTFKLPLPKGFSGSWNDLSDKPDIYTQTEANNKFVTKVANKGLSTHDYDDIAQSKVKDIPGIKEDVKALQDTQVQVYDGLDSDSITEALSAAQGKDLQAQINNIDIQDKTKLLSYEDGFSSSAIVSAGKASEFIVAYGQQLDLDKIDILSVNITPSNFDTSVKFIPFLKGISMTASKYLKVEVIIYVPSNFPALQTPPRVKVDILYREKEA